MQRLQRVFNKSLIFYIYNRKGCKQGSSWKVCQGCGGKKVVFKAVQVGPGMYAKTRAPCDECHGIT